MIYLLEVIATYWFTAGAAALVLAAVADLVILNDMAKHRDIDIVGLLGDAIAECGQSKLTIVVVFFAVIAGGLVSFAAVCHIIWSYDA